MNDRIKQAFDKIHAEDALIEKTKTYVAEQAIKKQDHHTGRPLPQWAAAAVCLLLVLFAGGYWAFLLPTATISMEINPSLELKVNRMGRVVEAVGTNRDGDALADALDIGYESYEEAVKQILESEPVAGLLAQNEVITFAVSGNDETQCEEILSGLETCTAGQQNAYCYFASSTDMAAAQQAGLSYGKYRALLELRELDPSVTATQVQGLTMRQIRDWIASLQNQTSDASASSTTAQQGQGQGQGLGQYGHQQGNTRSQNGQGKRAGQTNAAP